MLAPQIVREAPLADVLVIARRPDDRTVYAHLGRDSRRLRFHKAGDASDFEKAVREDTDPTTSSTRGRVDRAGSKPGLRLTLDAGQGSP